MTKLENVNAQGSEMKQIYETPTLVRLDAAKKLLLGPTWVEPYYDCQGGGRTRYRPNC